MPQASIKVADHWFRTIKLDKNTTKVHSVNRFKLYIFFSMVIYLGSRILNISTVFLELLIIKLTYKKYLTNIKLKHQNLIPIQPRKKVNKLNLFHRIKIQMIKLGEFLLLKPLYVMLIILVIFFYRW